MDIKQEKKDNFALYFLFPEAVVFDREKLSNKIKQVSNKPVEVQQVVGLKGKKEVFVRVVVEGEVFELVGMDTPLPQNIIDYTVGCAYGTPKRLEEMRNHQYHMLVFYRGENKNRMAIFEAYKKLAYGLLEQGLIGVANPYSWNAINKDIIKGMFEDKEMKAFSETPAMMIWRTFLKVPHNEGMWFVTKGNNLFDIAEYAYFGTMEEAEEIYDIFENIFDYAYETGKTIVAGDTMQIEEDTYLRFREVYELEDQLQGEKIETLVIEKITADECNQ